MTRTLKLGTQKSHHKYIKKGSFSPNDRIPYEKEEEEEEEEEASNISVIPALRVSDPCFWAQHADDSQQMIAWAVLYMYM